MVNRSSLVSAAHRIDRARRSQSDRHPGGAGLPRVIAGLAGLLDYNRLFVFEELPKVLKQYL
jgi:hypothetical protein